MARVYFTVSAKSIRQALKEEGVKPIIAISKNPQVLKKIAEKGLELVTPYVPMKSGALRQSGHVAQHARQTKLVWGRAGDHDPPTNVYARYQYYLDSKNMTTPGTESLWTLRLMRGTPEFRELVDYATPLVKKEVKKNGR